MKAAIVYWSGTGNTEEMAKNIAEGVRSKGGEVDLLLASEFTTNMISNYDSFAFGCPSMGSEVLEESEFEPMFEAVKNNLFGKSIGLFGSYGWGDGEWMRNWVEDCNKLGLMLVGDTLIVNDSPSAENIDKCKELGAILV